MTAGEESFFYGLLGHDGIPTPNYREYQKIAADMKKLDQYAGGEKLTVAAGERKLRLKTEYYEILELHSARPYAVLEGKDLCAVSVNSYGKGKVFYTALRADADLLFWLVEQLTEELGLKHGLPAPEGVQARKIAEGQYFFVNTTDNPVEIALPQAGKGVLSGNFYQDRMTLQGYDAELIVAEREG